MSSSTSSSSRRRVLAAAVGLGLSSALGAGVAGSAGAAPTLDDGARTSAAPNKNSVWVGTHNTLRGAGSFPAFAGVIGWQEVNDPADRTKMRNRLGKDYAHETFSGAASAVPISWRTARFAKVAQGSVRTHAGEAKVTPARYVNWVILRERSTGKKFAVVNTHFISGAWSTYPKRQARWLKHLSVLKSTVRKIQSTHKVPVVVVGDFNRRRAEALPGLRMLDVAEVKGITIDQIYVPKGAAATKSTQLPKHGSDHHAYKARVDW